MLFLIQFATFGIALLALVTSLDNTLQDISETLDKYVEEVDS